MIWNFCLHSVFRQYGWSFLGRIALPHPLRTIRAFVHAGKIENPGEIFCISGDFIGGGRSIVGVGFCLKPIEPPCPAGRANHDCFYLENHQLSDAPPCLGCVVREVGGLTLKTGSAFYIMTSARDILEDVFIPSLRAGRFDTGLFVLCRYSFQPFAVAMMAAGIRGYIFQLKGAVCRNYHTWLQADRGIKNEQTVIKNSSRAIIDRILMDAAKQKRPCAGFKKLGNIYFAED